MYPARRWFPRSWLRATAVVLVAAMFATPAIVLRPGDLGPRVPANSPPVPTSGSKPPVPVWSEQKGWSLSCEDRLPATTWRDILCEPGGTEPCVLVDPSPAGTRSGPHRASPGVSRTRWDEFEAESASATIEVERVFRRHQRGIRYCYDRDLVADSPRKESVSIRFGVAQGTRTSDVLVSGSTAESKGLAACVAREFRRMRFDPLAVAAGGAHSVTFRFERASSDR